MKFNAGHCLINDFFHCQVLHLYNIVGKQCFVELEKLLNKATKENNQKVKWSYADIMMFSYIKPYVNYMEKIMLYFMTLGI